jgi:hypothetical protein
LRFIKCQLKKVLLARTEFCDCEFYESEFERVSFIGSAVDNFITKASNLEDIN